jgi:tetrahydromethanopterin S-methyltransferase subunit G
MNKKLQEIGKKLNITEKDIQRIQKGLISRKILGIIVGVAIAILAFILWLLWKKETGPTSPSPGYPFSHPETPTPTPPTTPTPPPGGGYPFVPPAIMGGYLFTKKKNSKVVAFLISAVDFLSSLIAYPVFGQAIKYNVYKKRSLKDFLVALIAIPIFGQAIKYNVYSKR